MSDKTVVRWWDKNGGWQFGVLLNMVGREARVEQAGKVRRVNQSELRQWPPPPPEPTARKARRK